MSPLPGGKEFAELLEMHHKRLGVKVDELVAKLKASRTRKNANVIDPAIHYWERVGSGLKWSTAIAKQRAGIK